MKASHLFCLMRYFPTMLEEFSYSPKTTVFECIGGCLNLSNLEQVN